MKKLLLLIFLLPLSVVAQEKERLSRAYLGIMLHDFSAPGISLVNNFGINRYLGIGAGVDITRYESETLVPVYGDLRFRYPINDWAPFAVFQGGYSLYNKTDNAGYTDGTGRPLKTTTKGDYFLAGGIGISYKKGKVGGYLSYIQRAYYYKYTKLTINGRDIPPDNPVSVGVITLGFIF